MKTHPSRILVSTILLTAVLAVGCAVVRPLVDPVVSAAACAAVTKYPQATPYMASAAQVFIVAGSGNPPTPADLSVLLDQIPGTDVNSIYAAAIWKGAVGAYDLLYAAAKTPAAKANLQVTLTGLGNAMAEAVAACGPKEAATGTLLLGAQRANAPAAAIIELAGVVEQQLKSKAK